MQYRLPDHADVVVIGAGPSGAGIASWLADNGIYPLVLERQQFPRFSIGESLLPESLNCLEQLGLLDVVEAANYQFKNGASFVTNESRYDVNFSKGFSSGKDYAYQVPRGDFDNRLIRRCEEKGAEVVFQSNIIEIEELSDGYQLGVEHNGEMKHVSAKFLVDASGFGRVLARALRLDKPSTIPEKIAYFCHLEADLNHPEIDRNKILIAQQYVDTPAWFWLIPFVGNTCSVGVVIDKKLGASTDDWKYQLDSYIKTQDLLFDVVGGRPLVREVSSLRGYSSSISKLYGERFVILGNAGEFIDPIFSSGVTIALKSALLAAPLVAEVVKENKQPNWEERFQVPLMEGVNTFREYVTAWYAGTLPTLFHTSDKSEKENRMISSVLAGYVWDRSNPFTRMTASKLKALLAWT